MVDGTYLHVTAGSCTVAVSFVVRSCCGSVEMPGMRLEMHETTAVISCSFLLLLMREQNTDRQDGAEVYQGKFVKLCVGGVVLVFLRTVIRATRVGAQRRSGTQIQIRGNHTCAANCCALELEVLRCARALTKPGRKVVFILNFNRKKMHRLTATLNQCN